MPKLSANDDARLDPIDGPFEAPDNGSVDASIVEAPGVVRDKWSGKVWTLPTDTFDDQGLATYKSPRDIPKDPIFHYEFHRIDELSEYVSQGFVPVTRAELGLDEFVSPSQPSPLDSYYTIEGMDICVKIPRQLADRRYAANKAICDAAREGVKRGIVTTANGASRDVLVDDREPVERKLDQRQDRNEPVR